VLADPDMTHAVAEEARRIGATVLWASRDYRIERDAAAADGRWTLRWKEREWRNLPPPALLGDVQVANAAASIIAVAQLDRDVGDGAIRTALREASVPGRFQRFGSGDVEWILDVAHNEPAARVLARQLAGMPCRGRRYTVAGILGDKDIDAVARALAPVTDEWILCGIDDPRGLTSHALAGRSPVFAGAREAPDIPAGITLARGLARSGDRVVVCGSFLAVAPALAMLRLY
jgi:dihydrofolate synthase/folylpolyglutamate synthase